MFKVQIPKISFEMTHFVIAGLEVFSLPRSEHIWLEPPLDSQQNWGRDLQARFRWYQ